jgi:serine/threonine protein kinase
MSNKDNDENMTDKNIISKSRLQHFRDNCKEHEQYELLSVLGKGTYGVVYKAIDKKNNRKNVAIKCVYDCYRYIDDAKKVLREVKFLRLLKEHPNIVTILKILTPYNKYYNDIYIVFEDMDCDMKTMIEYNANELTDEHLRYFLFQLLCSLKCLHSCNIFHRDIKPSNILVMSDCKLKLCDFGLAKLKQYTNDDKEDNNIWTDYVATRWYRAPELCGAQNITYNKSIDIWSVGCVFAEICNGYPIFKGKNALHQLMLIINMVGKPDLKTLEKYYYHKATKFIVKYKIPDDSRSIDASIHPKIECDAVDLLYFMLDPNPETRLNVDELLGHKYFDEIKTVYGEEFYNEMIHADEQIDKENISKEFQFERNKDISLDELRNLMNEEIKMWKEPSAENP